MVWYSVSDSHKVMTATIVMLLSTVFLLWRCLCNFIDRLLSKVTDDACDCCCCSCHSSFLSVVSKVVSPHFPAHSFVVRIQTWLSVWSVKFRLTKFNWEDNFMRTSSR
jgi:hypothetical protein